jgi:hypothetical protein
MLRDLRLILVGGACIWFWEWIRGVPEIWAPELNLGVTWALICLVTVAMILTEKADA